MSTRTRTSAALASIAGLTVALLGAVPASAASGSAAEDLSSRMDEMGVDRTTADAVVERFEGLPSADQRSFLAAFSADPTSVAEFGSTAAPEDPVSSASPLSRGSARYTATYPVRVSVLGIDTGTFNLRYVFEATPTAVTRNLECTGWFSGTAGFWSVNETTSSYISVSTGTCKVIHRMSAVYKGSWWSANKEQAVSYRGTVLSSGYLRNI